MVEIRNLSDTLLASYAYDGNSMQVIKVVGGTRWWFLYAGGQLVSEYTDAASNTYTSPTSPGSAPSDSQSTLLYQHSDHLTTRVTTDNGGNYSNAQAHYPYGENWYATGTADPSVKRKFTSYRKETDSSLASGQINYAIARYHGARIGRFNVPGPTFSKAGPQSVNKYSFGNNDPVNRPMEYGIFDNPILPIDFCLPFPLDFDLILDGIDLPISCRGRRVRVPTRLELCRSGQLFTEGRGWTCPGVGLLPPWLQGSDPCAVRVTIDIPRGPLVCSVHTTYTTRFRLEPRDPNWEGTITFPMADVRFDRAFQARGGLRLQREDNAHIFLHDFSGRSSAESFGSIRWIVSWRCPAGGDTTWEDLRNIRCHPSA